MNIKAKMIMLVCIMFFMVAYTVIFGSKNTVIGLVIALASLMNLKNDLSYKPALSFVKIWALLLILGIAAYLNNPINELFILQATIIEICNFVLNYMDVNELSQMSRMKSSTL